MSVIQHDTFFLEKNVFLIFLAVAHAALVKALFSAQFVQNEKLAYPELLLFRDGSAVHLSFEPSTAKFRLKRLLFFIRGVCNPHADKLPQKLSQWGRSCIARATAMDGNVYGLLGKFRPPKQGIWSSRTPGEKILKKTCYE